MTSHRITANFQLEDQFWRAKSGAGGEKMSIVDQIVHHLVTKRISITGGVDHDGNGHVQGLQLEAKPMNSKANLLNML